MKRLRSAVKKRREERARSLATSAGPIGSRGYCKIVTVLQYSTIPFRPGGLACNALDPSKLLFTDVGHELMEALQDLPCMSAERRESS